MIRGLLLLGVGCGGGPATTGLVTDRQGEPLEQAHITAVGTLCQTTTDAEGHFRLPCRPGAHRVAITRRGYLSEEMRVELGPEPQDLGTLTLVSIPEGEGLFLLEGARFSEMAPAHLGRQDTGPARTPTGRAWCAVEGADTHHLPTREVSLFAKGVGDWRIFRLDEEGCARRLAREGDRWVVAWDERPQGTARTVSAGQSVHTLDLDPGRYAVVPWRAGRFQEDRSATADAGEPRYRAHLLVVEEAATP